MPDSPKRQIAISQPALGLEEWEALKEPIMSGWVTQGPKVAEFEKLFAKRHDVKHAIGVTSCTTGLHLALVAMGISPGDEVVVPAFTWIATANAVLYCGASPVFVDVDRTTFNIDPNQLAEKITRRTKAIIPVHLFGLCADMNAIRKVIPKDIKILEDAACAAGSSYKRDSAGSLGDAAVFSFHPRKSITTGEGGMITTNDDQLAEKLNMLRNHGASISEEHRHHGPKPYLLPDFNILGFNYRMTDLQGAIGIVQLSKLDSFRKERQKWATYYNVEFARVKWLRTPTFSVDYQHGWQAYVCYVDEKKAPMSRNRLMEYLQGKGISTRPGTHAVHIQGFYRKQYNIKSEDYPAALDCDSYTMALPLHNCMSKEDYEYIVKCIKDLER
jgi:perosamine synthetase